MTNNRDGNDVQRGFGFISPLWPVSVFSDVSKHESSKATRLSEWQKLVSYFSPLFHASFFRPRFPWIRFLAFLAIALMWTKVWIYLFFRCSINDMSHPTHPHARKRARVRAHTRIHMHTYTSTHTHTQSNTHTLTHAHTYTRTLGVQPERALLVSLYRVPSTDSCAMPRFLVLPYDFL